MPDPDKEDLLQEEFVILNCTNASGKQGVLFCPQLTGGYCLVYVSIETDFLKEDLQ